MTHLEKYMKTRRKEFANRFERPCDNMGDLTFEDIWSNDNPNKDEKTMEEYALETNCVTNRDIVMFKKMFVAIKRDGEWEDEYNTKCNHQQCQEFRQKYPEDEVGISLNHKPLVQLLLHSCETQPPHGRINFSAPERLWHEIFEDDVKDVEKKIQVYDKLVAQYGKHKFLADFVGSKSFAKGETSESVTDDNKENSSLQNVKRNAKRASVVGKKPTIHGRIDSIKQ